MKHRHFKLNQVKARIEGRKALSKQFRAVSKEELKEEYGVDWPPTKVVVVDDEDNLTPDALKERGAIVLTKEEAQKVIDSKEWKEFWAKVRAGEIENVEM